jgi:glucose/arabinose dehydrogenase
MWKQERMPWKHPLLILCLGLTALLGLPAFGQGALDHSSAELTVGGQPRTLTIPTGYSIEALTEDLDRPRIPTFGPDGSLFIGSRSGKVYRLTPPYRRAQVFVETGDYPHSVAFRDGRILVARTDGLYSAPYRPAQGRLDPEDLSLLAPLPGGGGHSSRTVHVGPDGRIYVSLGLSGNCSNQYLGDGYPFEDRRGGILVLDEQAGSKATWRTYASGLRNPVGFDWQPSTGVMYASNNGPDHWGFDLPPEYFSRIEPGGFYGMPWFQLDGSQLRRDPCIKTSPPQPASAVSIPPVTFAARSAPLGVAFVPAGAMTPSFVGDAVVALHGSWATEPYGTSGGNPATRREPKLVLVRFSGGEAEDVVDLVTGFQLTSGRRWARPAGVAFGPDGALYFTSDAGANALFRLSKKGG